MSRPGSTVAVVPSTPMGSQQPHALYATHDERDNETTDFIAKRSPSTMLQRFKYIAIGTTALSVVLLIVVIAVASSKKGGGDCGPSPPSPTTPGNAGGAFTDDTKVPDLAAQFAKLVNNESIKAFMTEYSLYPHNTASARNVELAEMTANYYKSFGFDEYRVDRIPVLLSQLTDHSVTVNDDAGHPRYRATLYEPNILFELNYSQAILPSNAYSGTGDVTAPIVWVNYGRLQDFQEAQKHVNIIGKIVVVRYGQIFRGNKAAFAEQFGAVGCIIVMDPADVAQGTVFPLGPWATNATVQRGSLLLSDGDPRTPLWPSEDGGPTMPDADLFDPTKGVGTPLPSIPVQPMGYGDATEMLRGLGGASLPNGTADWRSTGFLGVMGGGMGPSKYTVRLMVQRELVVDHLANAHGVIRGAVEPDRVVNIGGHRDAWTYGAVDPISGASISLEIARCLGELLKTGWRPRRTIQFSSWGGEEQALLGSTEYVQGEVEMLRERSVAYINLDTPVTGNDVFTLEGSPSFLNLALDVGKSYTAYGVTLQKRMAVQTISPPGSGSDHTSFIQLAGVPVFVPELTSSDGRYGAVYHTNYDTVFWVEHFGDPLYDGHKAVAQLVGDMVLKLAGLNVLPLNLEAYSTSVAGWVAAYETASNLKTFDFSFMDAQVALFSANAKNFEVSKQAIANTIALEYPAVTAISPYLLRDFNDRTSGLERVFLGGSQETLSLFFKHVLFTPSAIDSYGSSVMPMVAAALNTGDPAQGNFALGRIAQFVSRAARFLNTSTHIL